MALIFHSQSRRMLTSFRQQLQIALLCQMKLLDQSDLLGLANYIIQGNWQWIEGQWEYESDVSHPHAPTNPSTFNVMSLRPVDPIVFQLPELAWLI